MDNHKDIRYLDNASTTKVDPRVLEEMLPFFTEIYGNASSNHIYGQRAKNAIETARMQVASIINAQPRDIIFTSGATESINLALKGYYEANFYRGNHIITVKTEHKAVLATCEYLESKGAEVTYLDVDDNGLISLEELRDSIKPTTILISVMYVNNEIGIIQPIKEIGNISREHDIIFFCDATQAVGKVEVDIIDCNISMLCFSGHKLNGPKGIGVLFKSSAIELTPLIHGGGQEFGLRGGTYNTPLIVGLGKACEIAVKEYEKNREYFLAEREKIIDYFTRYNLGIVNFNNSNYAHHILSVMLKNIEAEDFLIQKSYEFVASTGSACNAELIEDSHVLQAIFPNLKVKNILRISF